MENHHFGCPINGPFSIAFCMFARVPTPVLDGKKKNDGKSPMNSGIVSSEIMVEVQRQEGREIGHGNGKMPWDSTGEIICVIIFELSNDK